MYKEDLALNNLQWLTAIKPNQPTDQLSDTNGSLNPDQKSRQVLEYFNKISHDFCHLLSLFNSFFDIYFSKKYEKKYPSAIG